MMPLGWNCNLCIAMKHPDIGYFETPRTDDSIPNKCPYCGNGAEHLISQTPFKESAKTMMDRITNTKREATNDP